MTGLAFSMETRSGLTEISRRLDKLRGAERLTFRQERYLALLRLDPGAFVPTPSLLALVVRGNEDLLGPRARSRLAGLEQGLRGKLVRHGLNIQAHPLCGRALCLWGA